MTTDETRLKEVAYAIGRLANNPDGCCQISEGSIGSAIAILRAFSADEREDELERIVKPTTLNWNEYLTQRRAEIKAQREMKI